MIKTHTIEAAAAAAAAVSERQSAPGEMRSAPMTAAASPLRPAPRDELELEKPAPEPTLRAPELRPRDGNGNGARHFTGNHEPPAPAADSRRTLHLSLGGNGAEPAPLAAVERQAPRQPQPAPPPNRPAPPPAAVGNPAALRMLPESTKARDSGGIDLALRERVEADVAAFLAAFDTALASDTPESRAGLREATDRLLRAGARTRIELERLEARVPLPPRDRRDHESLEWRHR